MTPPWRLVFVIAVCVPLSAAADRYDDDLAALRSQVGWGASVNPERVSLATEGGWNGGARRAVVAATVEATVVPRASVFASAQYGGTFTNARPALGIAYQLLDPRTSGTGARITVAYKPEGFTEPEGEIESVLVASRLVRGDALRALVAYGQDPEGREADAEVGASYMHRAAPSMMIGVTSRFRHAIKVRTTMEPSWDFIAGGVGSVMHGRSRVELLLGVDAIAYTAPAHTGVVGLLSISTDL